MAANLYQREILGGVSENQWAGAFTSKTLSLIIESTGDDAQKRGRSVLSKVERRYKNQPPQTLAEFKNFLELCTKTEAVSYVAALIINSILYAAVGKNGVAYIHRGTECVSLLSAAGSVSGNLAVGDKLLLVSHEFQTGVSREIIEQVLTLADSGKIVKALTTQLHQRSEFPKGAAVFVKINSLSASSRLPFKTIEQTARKQLQFLAGTYHVRHFVRKYRLVFFLLVAALAVAFGGQTWWRSSQIEKQKKNQVEDLFSQTSHLFSEGMALIDLNPIRARQLLKEAQGILTTQQAQASDAKLQGRIASELGKVETGLKTALRSFDIVPSAFYQLDLLFPGGLGDQMRLYEDVLIVLDRQNHQLYRIGAQTKAAKTIANADMLHTAKSIAVHAEDVYILADAVYTVTPDGGLKKVIDNVDNIWQAPSLISAYEGNVYLVDTVKNWIWKYYKNEEGFSAIQDYFLFDTIANLNGMTDLEIDGWVWLARGKDIMRFAQGKQDVWNIADLPTPLGQNVNLYVDPSLHNLYILDAGNQRVVVVDKTGVYLSEYHWASQLEISDFVVSEALKKILLLSRGTIYAVELR